LVTLNSFQYFNIQHCIYFNWYCKMWIMGKSCDLRFSEGCVILMCCKKSQKLRVDGVYKGRNMSEFKSD